jgi:hypothetical protein
MEVKFRSLLAKTHLDTIEKSPARTMHRNCPYLPYGKPKRKLVVAVVPPKDGYVRLRTAQTFLTVLWFFEVT